MSDVQIPLARPIQRYFTPDEANVLLLELRPLLHALVEVIINAEEVAELLEATAHPNERAAINRDLEELRIATRDQLGEIITHGVLLKRIQPILLDFPAQHNGQDVLLCWREGESEVAWWHPIHTGIRGRRPVADEAPLSWEYWS
ncbi:MAG: DUF2203 family protein [Rhodobacterales bacterium]|nr:DUF2203 family protein [Rhodobacterales bacterium]